MQRKLKPLEVKIEKYERASQSSTLAAAAEAAVLVAGDRNPTLTPAASSGDLCRLLLMFLIIINTIECQS